MGSDSSTEITNCNGARLKKKFTKKLLQVVGIWT